MKPAFNWELFIALIALAVSVLSPVLNSIINSTSERKKYYQQNYYEHRAKIIEGFIASAEKRVAKILSGRAYDEPYTFEQTDYFHEIHFYVSPRSIEAIDELEEKLKEKRLDSVSTKLKNVIDCLTDEPPRRSK